MTAASHAPAPRPLADPGLPLVAALPLAALIWLVMLLGFARMLELTAAPPSELKPVEARIVELPPPAVGGLQSSPARAAPRPIAKPHPIVRPHVRLRQLPPPPAPSINGTAHAKPASPAPSTSSSSRSTAPAAPAPAAPAGAGLGSDTSGARALFAPTPEIPDDLRDQPLDTVAIAHFKVTADGQVSVDLVKPTSNPELNQVLLDTLKQWRFFPAMRSGVAIPAEFDVRIPISVQ